MINIIVDELINSIRNRVTGEVFDTNIIKIDSYDSPQLKKGWNFDWIKERKEHDVYKLTTDVNPEIIQGLISIQEKQDSIFINLVESASFNIGPIKVYEGVAGNLFGFACHYAYRLGFEGIVSFLSKTNLIAHYEKALGAKRIGNSLLMKIETDDALLLIDRYYGNKKQK
jgi:hypothetical protein